MKSYYYTFICDQMLYSLGKWLRVAGYDTAFVEAPAKYKTVLMQAVKEHRLFLTCNTHLLQIKEFDLCGIYLKSNSLKDCISELNHKLQLDWLYHPFSRCVLCNTLLEAPPGEAWSKFPSDILLESGQRWYCKHCDKVYWVGSHTKRMYKKLHQWKKL